MIPTAVLALVVALMLLWQCRLNREERAAHDRERGQWREEREALLNRCVPGLSLGPPPPIVDRHWSDAREAALERQRNEGK